MGSVLQFLVYWRFIGLYIGNCLFFRLGWGCGDASFFLVFGSAIALFGTGFLLWFGILSFIWL